MCVWSNNNLYLYMYRYTVTGWWDIVVRKTRDFTRTRVRDDVSRARLCFLRAESSCARAPALTDIICNILHCVHRTYPTQPNNVTCNDMCSRCNIMRIRRATCIPREGRGCCSWVQSLQCTAVCRAPPDLVQICIRYCGTNGIAKSPWQKRHQFHQPNTLTVFWKNQTTSPHGDS